MTQDPEVHPEAVRLVMYPGGSAMVVSRTDAEALDAVARMHGLVNGGLVIAHFPTPEEVFQLTHMGIPTYRHDED